MNIEFHYYIVYYLARKAGFAEEDCYRLAYASQFTDDNSMVYKLQDASEEEHNYISQTMNILRPMTELMHIYLCFHFVPGDLDSSTAFRYDGKLHFLNTTPNSKIARQLVSAAFATGNIYRIGIAIHAYADTWAHQNFIGCKDYLNGNKRWLHFFLPKIGHAVFLTQPDIVNLKWIDNRLASSLQSVDNQQRMLEAAKHIYLILKAYADKRKMDDLAAIVKETDPAWEAIEKELRQAMGGEPIENMLAASKKRHERMLAYANLLDRKFTHYDRYAWFKAAIETKKRGFKDKPQKFGRSSFIPDLFTKKAGYEESDWLHFQQAVKAHQKFARQTIEPITQKMELDGF